MIDYVMYWGGADKFESVKYEGEDAARLFNEHIATELAAGWKTETTKCDAGRYLVNTSVSLTNGTKWVLHSLTVSRETSAQ